jgi:hypothetical protein
MLLDLTRAASFFLSIVTLYWVTISAFFVPGASLQDRLFTALLRLALAAIAVLFLGSWYLATYPCSINISHDCNL